MTPTTTPQLCPEDEKPDFFTDSDRDGGPIVTGAINLDQEQLPVPSFDEWASLIVF